LDGACTSVGIAVLSLTQEIRAITDRVARTEEVKENQGEVTITTLDSACTSVGIAVLSPTQESDVTCVFSEIVLAVFTSVTAMDNNGPGDVLRAKLELEIGIVEFYS
jgi:hypothetical protein